MTAPTRAVALALLLLAGCTDRDLTSTDPSNPPGQGAPTLEVFLTASDLADAWFDTTLVGFARATDAVVHVVAQESNFRSRSLLRFPSFAQRAFINDTLRDAREFRDGRLVVRLDSTRSAVSAGGVLSLYDVETSFDARTATWTFAVDTPGGQVRWSAAGGALGTPIASDTFDANADADTVIVGTDTVVGALVLPLGAATDSLLRAWSDTLSPHPGLVLALETTAGDVRLEFPVPAIQYKVRPDVEVDTVVSFTQLPLVRTFIFDPPLPDPGESLAVAGFPAARAYLEIRPPDSVVVDGVLTPLRGSSVNRAELWLTSRPPVAPFAAVRAFTTRTFGVVDDVRVFGPKTPLRGEVAEGRGTVSPDSLPDGARFEVGLTSLFDAWSAVPADSTPRPIRFAIRAEPEAVGVGRWAFAAAGQPGEPVLRIVFTPRTRFELP